MTKRLERNFDFIKILCKNKKKNLRRAILENADPDLILCLCECCDNLLKGNVPINSEQKQKLSKHKNHIRNLANRKNTIKEKRNILIQQGGFLPLLLTPILSIAGSLIADAITGR